MLRWLRRRGGRDQGSLEADVVGAPGQGCLRYLHPRAGQVAYSVAGRASEEGGKVKAKVRQEMEPQCEELKGQKE